MIGLIFNIAQVAAGILLAQSALMKFDQVDETVNKVANWLAPFKSIIGIATFALGILRLIGEGCFINDLLGVATGLLLLGMSFHKVPAIGGLLVKASTFLKAFAIPIGVGAIVFGLFAIFSGNCLL